jgi:hypothetical protein
MLPVGCLDEVELIRRSSGVWFHDLVPRLLKSVDRSFPETNREVYEGCIFFSILDPAVFRPDSILRVDAFGSA